MFKGLINIEVGIYPFEFSSLGNSEQHNMVMVQVFLQLVISFYYFFKLLPIHYKL